MKIKYFITTAVILIAGLIIWDTYPIQKTNIKLVYTKNDLSLITESSCIGIDELLERPWEISFPATLQQGKSEFITAVLQDDSLSLSTKPENSRVCNSVIEARLEIPLLSQKNGEKILAPYAAGFPQQFNWKIEGSDEDSSGTLWITLLYEENGGQITRLPLYSVPIEINGISIFGFAPKTFRLILAMIILLAVLIQIWKYIQRTNDII